MNEEVWNLNRKSETEDEWWRQMEVSRWSAFERKRMSRLYRVCVVHCGRVSDCNDCSKVTGLISGRAAQSGTITA